MIITRKLSRPDQIKKFRKLCGESLQIDDMYNNVLALCDDLCSEEIEDSAQLGDLYTAGELRAVGAWWKDQNFLVEIAGMYMMNVVFTCAELVKLDKVKERETVISVVKMYGTRQIKIAERLLPILADLYGDAEYNEEAAALCHQRREEYMASLDPSIVSQAIKMTEEMMP